MTVPSLQIDYDQIRRSLAVYLGIDQDPSNWSSDITTTVDDIIRDGLLNAYHPPPIQGMQVEWSFLRPVTEITTSDDTWEYTLPANFARLFGPVPFGGTAAYGYPAVRETHVYRIYQLRNQQTTKGIPQWCAVRTEENSGAGGVPPKLIVHPTPDDTYKLEPQYVVQQEMLSASNPYPLGGVAFGKVVLASCLAAAELMLEETRGVRYQEFMDRVASYAAEELRKAPKFLGYSGPRLQREARRSAFRDMINYGTVTYEGQEYLG